jgi:hypothetical protein
MKRILKIIAILIVAFFIVLGIIWLIGRNKAINNGTQPLTFREFLGLATKKNPVQTVPSTGSSDFTDTTGTGGTNGTGNGTGGAGTGFNSGNGGFNVNSSTFTSGTYNASGTGSNTNGNGSNSGSNGSTTGTNTSGTNGTGADSTSPGDSSAGSQPVCSDEDTNIPFTPDQLAQLNILQSRFYALAQTLHNDADVETEVANHDSFETKADSIFEEYAYCESKLPTINSDPNNDPRLKLHLATPFWRSWHDEVATDIDPYVAARIKSITGVTLNSDPARDSLSFLTYIKDFYNDPQQAYTHSQEIHDKASGEVALPANEIDRILPDVSRITGPYGLLSFSSPENVQNSSASSLGDFGIIVPVTEKFLRLNLW